MSGLLKFQVKTARRKLAVGIESARREFVEFSCYFSKIKKFSDFSKLWAMTTALFLIYSKYLLSLHFYNSKASVVSLLDETLVSQADDDSWLQAVEDLARIFGLLKHRAVRIVFDFGQLVAVFLRQHNSLSRDCFGVSQVASVLRIGVVSEKFRW